MIIYLFLRTKKTHEGYTQGLTITQKEMDRRKGIRKGGDIDN